MENKEKVEFYEQAKATIELLKKAGSKAAILMNIKDKIYFAIQKLLQGRQGNDIKALGPGKEEIKETNEKSGLREQLYNPEYTKKTDDISRKYINGEIQPDENIKEDEYVK